MTTTEVKEIVRSEIKKAFKEELGKILKASIKNGDLKKDTNFLIKKSLDEFVKFLYNRRSVWQNEIGK